MRSERSGDRIVPPGASSSRMDWRGWKRFASAMSALGMGFLLAIYSNIFAEQGRLAATAICASAALLLSGYVALTAVPYLARRASLEWLRVSIDYQLTREGLIFIAMVFLLAVAGLNTGNNLLYLVVASLLAAILMSGVLSLAVLSSLSLEILLPEHVFARTPVAARVRLENEKKIFPSFSVTLNGSVDGNLKGKRPRRTSKHAASNEESEAGIFDRPLYFAFLPPGRALTTAVELRFARRGMYHEKGFSLSTRFPFGFLEKKMDLEVSRQLCVYPAIEPTEHFYNLLPMITGELEAFQRGFGHDLYSVRDMLTTDTVRHVDWKASAHTGELKVREFTREDDRRLEVIFDPRIGPFTSASLERFEAAVELCACLVWHFCQHEAQLQFSCGEFEITAAHAAEVVYDVLRHLALVSPLPEDPLDPSDIKPNGNGFRVVLTAAARTSVAASAWQDSYFVFFEELGTAVPSQA